MHRIILDKSSLVAVPGELLHSQLGIWEYLLPSSLLFEIRTDRRDYKSLLRKALNFTNDKWSPAHHELAIWELQQGCSARQFIGNPGILRTINQCYDESPVDKVADCQRRVEMWNDLPIHDDDRSRITEWRKSIHSLAQFYVWLEGAVARDSWDLSGIRNLEKWSELAASHGVQMSSDFQIARGWFCYGWDVAGIATLKYRLWTRLDGPMSKVKPECFGFDAQYLAHLSITDGILSNDAMVLGLAWACWPEKRQHIYTYDQESKTIKPFVPEWEE